MEPIYRDPRHWRSRAADARAVAEKISDPESKRVMLEIADDYEQLAARAEIRLKAPPQSK